MLLIRYARKTNRHPVGAVVADIKDGKLRIGWSKCHLSLDRWNRKKAIEMAVARLERHGEKVANMTRQQLETWMHQVKDVVTGEVKTTNVVPDSLHDTILWMQEKATWNLINKPISELKKEKKSKSKKKGKKSKTKVK